MARQGVAATIEAIRSRGRQGHPGPGARAGGPDGSAARRRARAGRARGRPDDRGGRLRLRLRVRGCRTSSRRRLGELIEPHRQDVMHFQVPAGDRRYDAGAMPAWIDFEGSFYGFPSFDGLSHQGLPGLARADRAAATTRRASAPTRRSPQRARVPSAAPAGPRRPARGPDLDVLLRGHAGRPFRHRPPPGARRRLDRRRRDRPRLQARPGDRRVPRGARHRRRRRRSPSSRRRTIDSRSASATRARASGPAADDPASVGPTASAARAGSPGLAPGQPLAPSSATSAEAPRLDRVAVADQQGLEGQPAELHDRAPGLVHVDRELARRAGPACRRRCAARRPRRGRRRPGRARRCCPPCAPACVIDPQAEDVVAVARPPGSTAHRRSTARPLRRRSSTAPGARCRTSPMLPWWSPWWWVSTTCATASQPSPTWPERRLDRVRAAGDAGVDQRGLAVADEQVGRDEAEVDPRPRDATAGAPRARAGSSHRRRSATPRRRHRVTARAGVEPPVERRERGKRRRAAAGEADDRDGEGAAAHVGEEGSAVDRLGTSIGGAPRDGVASHDRRTARLRSRVTAPCRRTGSRRSRGSGLHSRGPRAPGRRSRPVRARVAWWP